jgi:hypothetical protein
MVHLQCARWWSCALDDWRECGPTWLSNRCSATLAEAAKRRWRWIGQDDGLCTDTTPGGAYAPASASGGAHFSATTDCHARRGLSASRSARPARRSGLRKARVFLGSVRVYYVDAIARLDHRPDQRRADAAHHARDRAVVIAGRQKTAKTSSTTASRHHRPRLP